MNIKEEVLLAIEMGIESALDFVYVAKMNYWYPREIGYYGMFNGRLIFLSRLATGKQIEAFGYEWWKKHPAVKKNMLDEQYPNLFLKEIWDPSTNLPYPKKYFFDEDCRLRYDRKMEERNISYFTEKAVFGTNNSQIWLLDLEESKERLDKINKKIDYRNHIKEIVESGGEIDRSKDFDISYLKTILISDFVDINRAGFFRVRPDDKTPSCKWYKEDNTWVDFGGDNQKHDVIDLIMLIKNLDFTSACRFLSFK